MIVMPMGLGRLGWEVGPKGNEFTCTLLMHGLMYICISYIYRYRAFLLPASARHTYVYMHVCMYVLTPSYPLKCMYVCVCRLASRPQ